MERLLTAFLACFTAFYAWAQGAQGEGTALLDDLDSKDRVVVDAFANASNKIHSLIQAVNEQTDGAISAATNAMEAVGTDRQIVRGLLTDGEWNLNVSYATHAETATHAVGAEYADGVPWFGIEGTPTTLAGYGVAEEVTNTVCNIVTNVVAASNPTFSNAVLAVGLNIDTNSVAVLNEIASTFGGFPIEGTATTVGGLLAALAAAIAWLRRNKADKTDLEGFATIEDLLAFYYPDGNVKSIDQITTNGIEYAVGEDGGAYAASGNGLSGHVVLPWKVTIGGKEYKVTAIGSSAFSDNSFTGLTAPTTVKTIKDSAFNNCISLTSVNLPSATSIGDSAFNGCGVLTTINLPSVTSIGSNAFSYCHSLPSINLPSATSIGGQAFLGCDFIKSVSLPSATTINSGAFDSCLSLESVSIPSAPSIGIYAFNGCGSLTTIDFGPSPKSAVPSLGSFAFEGVPTSCKFIIPIGMYDEWISADMWSNWYAQGYKFEGYASTVQLANKADKATTLAGYGITDAATMASLAPEYSPSSAYAVGSFVYHDGNMYQCKTSVPEGGEAWNAEHWELRKLDDFFTGSNSLLAGTIDARLPYPLYPVTDETGLLKDRAINTTSLASVTVPYNFTDLLVRASVASSLSVTMPETITTKYGDTFPGEAGEYLITITKTGASEAYVRTIKLEVANA